MAELELGVSSEGVKQGAQVFEQSADRIVKAAVKIAENIERIEQATRRSGASVGKLGQDIRTLSGTTQRSILVADKYGNVQRKIEIETKKASKAITEEDKVLKKTTKSITDAEKRLKAMDEEFRKFSSSLSVIAFGPLSGVGSRFIALNRLLGELSINTKAATVALVGLAVALTGAGIVAAITGTGRAIADTAAKLDQMQKSADSLGVTIEQLQALDFAAARSGAADVENILRRMNRAIGEAAGGEGEARTALETLGFDVKSLENLRRLNPAEQIQKVATAFGKIKEPAVQASVAADIFGARTKGIINLLVEEEGGLEGLIARYQELGLILPESIGRQAEEVTDRMTELNLLIDRFGQRFAVAAFPIFIEFVEWGLAKLPGWLEHLDTLLIYFGSLATSDSVAAAITKNAEALAYLDRQLADIEAGGSRTRSGSERAEAVQFIRHVKALEADALKAIAITRDHTAGVEELVSGYNQLRLVVKVLETLEFSKVVPVGAMQEFSDLMEVVNEEMERYRRVMQSRGAGDNLDDLISQEAQDAVKHFQDLKVEMRELQTVLDAFGTVDVFKTDPTELESVKRMALAYGEAATEVEKFETTRELLIGAEKIGLSREQVQLLQDAFEIHGNLNEVKKVFIDLLAQEILRRNEQEAQIERIETISANYAKAEKQREEDRIKRIERLNKEMEKFLDKRQKDQEKAAREAARDIARPFEQASKSIQRSLERAFKDAFEGNMRSAQDVADALLDIFTDMAAKLAALLVFRPQIISQAGGFDEVLKSVGLFGAKGGAGELSGVETKIDTSNVHLAQIAVNTSAFSSTTYGETVGETVGDSISRFLSSGVPSPTPIRPTGSGLIGDSIGYFDQFTKITGIYQTQSLDVAKESADALEQVTANTGDTAAEVGKLGGLWKSVSGKLGAGLGGFALSGGIGSLLGYNQAGIGGAAVGSIAGGFAGFGAIASGVVGLAVGGIFDLIAQEDPFKITRDAGRLPGNAAKLGAGVGLLGGTIAGVLGGSIASALTGIGTAVLGAKVGASLGSAIVPVIGTIIGALLGAIIGGIIQVTGKKPTVPKLGIFTQGEFGGRRAGRSVGGIDEGFLESPFGLISVKSRRVDRGESLAGFLRQFQRFDEWVARRLDAADVATVAQAIQLGDQTVVKIRGSEQQDIERITVARMQEIVRALGGNIEVLGISKRKGLSQQEQESFEAFISGIRDYRLGLRELSGEAIPEAERALRTLQDNFISLGDSARAYGTDLRELDAAYAQGIKTFKEDFVLNIGKSLADLIDPFTAAVWELAEAEEELLRETNAVNVGFDEMTNLLALTRDKVKTGFLEPVTNVLDTLRLGTGGGESAQVLFERNLEEFNAALMGTDPEAVADLAQDLLSLSSTLFGSTGFFFEQKGFIEDALITFAEQLGTTFDALIGVTEDPIRTLTEVTESGNEQMVALLQEQVSELQGLREEFERLREDQAVEGARL
jgi:hypothetical protein